MSTDVITSANSTFQITCSSLLDAAVTLENFSAERAWEFEGVELVETRMSMDGHLNVGVVPNPINQTITLEPASTSIPTFDTLIVAMRSTYTIYRLQGLISIPSTSMKYTLSNGVIVTASPAPSAARVMEPRSYTIRWESIIPGGV